MSSNHFDPYANRAAASDSEAQKSTTYTAPEECEDDPKTSTTEAMQEGEERLDAPRVLFLRDAFVGFGVSWSRTVCFRMELQLRLPFVLVSVGLGRPAIVRLGNGPAHAGE